MRTYLAALTLGVAAVIAGTLLGGFEPFLAAVAAPPIPVRAALVGAVTVVALRFLSRALTAMGGSDSPDRDMATMIRGVRFAFLAVAALAAAAGWFVGQPVLLIVALVIAGVDVVETTFLLIVARKHRESEHGR
jgi:hypothetical protein